MKSRDTLIRLKKFQVDEKRRKVMQIEGMIAEFERMATDLEREIKVEQDRAGIHDPTHFAYPTYAKAAIQRRENLKHSADELKAQLNDAKEAFQTEWQPWQLGRAGSKGKEDELGPGLNRLMQFNIEAGVHGLGVALGSEVFRLSEAERQQAIARLARAHATGAPVIATASPVTEIWLM